MRIRLAAQVLLLRRAPPSYQDRTCPGPTSRSRNELVQTSTSVFRIEGSSELSDREFRDVCRPVEVDAPFLEEAQHSSAAAAPRIWRSRPGAVSYVVQRSSLAEFHRARVQLLLGCLTGGPCSRPRPRRASSSAAALAPAKPGCADPLPQLDDRPCGAPSPRDARGRHADPRRADDAWVATSIACHGPPQITRARGWVRHRRQAAGASRSSLASTLCASSSRSDSRMECAGQEVVEIAPEYTSERTPIARDRRAPARAT